MIKRDNTLKMSMSWDSMKISMAFMLPIEDQHVNCSTVAPDA